MHYMASQATTNETDEDIFHDSYLQLQEHMRNPIAFHAEMTGNIMYLQQVLRQPDAKEFIHAVIKEVNRHVDCTNWTCGNKVKFLKTSRWSLQYGHYDASAISQQMKSSHTRPD
jgi:hypothetical protein